MKRLTTWLPAIVLVGVALLLWPATAAGQVITQLGQENLKIPRGEKPSPPPTRPTLSQDDFLASVDTTSVYYALLDSAQRCVAERNWACAESHIRAAIAAEPDNPSNSLLLSNLGTVQRYQGHDDDALRNYTMALHLTPNAVTLLLNRAALLADMGRNSEAEADYERVRQLDGHDAESRYSLGMMALERGDYKRAEELFTEIERVNPASGLALEGKAMLCKATGQMAKAVEYLTRLIKVRPDPRLLGNRADCCLAMGRLNDAQSDITAALEQTPDDGYLYVLRAKLAKMRYDREGLETAIAAAERCGLPRQLIDALLDGTATVN